MAFSLSSRDALIEKLERIWQQGEQPDPRQFLEAAGESAADIVASILAVDQWQRWHHGQRVSAEDYRRRWPVLGSDQNACLELIYGEFMVRHALGEQPAPSEYLSRFPQFAAELSKQFALFAALEQTGTTDPKTLSYAGSTQRVRSLATAKLAQVQALRNGGAAGPESADNIKPANDPLPLPDTELHLVTGGSNKRDADMPVSGISVPGYEILGELGRGKFGVVYKARDIKLNRLVAVKMVLAGVHASAEQLTRFLVEAEAVAQVQHANIVSIFEVGCCNDLPYFTLEYVSGGSLAQHSKGMPQPPTAAARIVEQLAQGVHAAHERGIIHRDLKPANVLLAADGTPKIADFGLAKRLEVGAGLTASGYAVGTPSYMAPEQADTRNRKIGPACDIYALGAILYELLTGRPPFQAADQWEIVRQVLIEEPVAPCQLQSKTPKDLETICLKCLQKEPGQRYATALALAEDIRHFQRGEPIRARPVGTLERMRKWAQRRPAVAALSGSLLVLTVLLVAALTAGIVISTRAFADAQAAQRREAGERQEAEKARDLAEQERSRAVQAEKAAEDKAEVARKVKDYLVAAFRNPDPYLPGDKVTVAQILRQAEQEIDKLDQPLMQEELLAAIGKTYLGLRLPAGVAVWEKVVALATKRLGPDDPGTLANMNNLAHAYEIDGQQSKALPLYEEILTKRRMKLGADHPITLESMNGLALAYKTDGQLQKALPLYEETLAKRKLKLGDGHPATLQSMNNLALAYQGDGQLKKALPMLEFVLEKWMLSLGAEHHETLTARSNLASAYLADGQFKKALPLFDETLAKRKVKLGTDHPLTAESIANLAAAYRALGRWSEALPLFEEAVDLQKAKLGPDNPDTLASINGLATAYGDAGRVNDAILLLEGVLKVQRVKLSAEHPHTLSTMNNLALMYKTAGRINDAIPLYEETLKVRKATLRADHPSTLLTMSTLAVAYKTAGRLNDALPLYKETFDLRKTNLGAEHPATLRSMSNLAVGYRVAGRVQEAIALLEEALKLQKINPGAEHPDTLQSMNNLAVAYRAANRIIDAVPLFEQVLKWRKSKLGADHADTLTSMSNLANTYDAVGRWNDALPLFEEVLKLTKAKFGAEDSKSLERMENLAVAYRRNGRPNDAKPLLEEALRVRKAKFGVDHPSLIRCLDELAFVYQAGGRLNDVPPLLEEKLRLTRAKGGPLHPMTLTSMHYLASAYQAAGRLKDAIPLFEETLKLRTTTLGAEAVLTLGSMDHLASAYQAAGRLDDALRLFQDVLKLRKTKYGAKDFDTLDSLNNLAQAYKAAGRLNDAEPLFREAVEGARPNLSKPNIKLQLYIDNLCACYEQLNELDKIEPLRRELAGYWKAKGGPESTDYATQLALLASNQLQRGKYADAEVVLLECLAIREKKAPEIWTTYNAKSLLGASLLGQKKYAAAEPFLVQGYEGVKKREQKIPELYRVRLIEALSRLVELYEATGQQDQAVRWRLELEAAKSKGRETKK